MDNASKTPRWLTASALYVSALLASVFAFVIICAADGLLEGGATLFTSVWAPEGGSFGIVPMIAATVVISLSALALGWCVSLGCVCFVHGFGGSFASALLLSLLRVMTAVPTVVYGFASVFLLVPLVRDGLGGSGFCVLSAVLVLSLLITPTMALSMESAVAQTEEICRLAAASLGLSRAQNLVFVVLPACGRWLRASALLGFGRAAGDTMIPVMLAGNAVQYPISPLSAVRALTAHIGLVLSSDVGGTAYYSLFVAGGILLLLGAGANLLFRFIRGGKDGK